jgi:hypothetical protein
MPQYLTRDQIDAFMQTLKDDPVKMAEYMRAVFGPPSRVLSKVEADSIMLQLENIKPFNESNNQHTWTSSYMLNEVEYQVTSFGNGIDCEVLEIT